MHFSRRFLLSAAVVAALSAPGPRSSLRAAPDDDPAKHRASTEELLKVMRLEQLVGDTLGKMGEQIDHIADNAAKQAGPGADQAALAQKIRTEAREILRKEFNWDALRPDFAQAYGEAFTESEIQDLINFYKTPTGQKLVAKQPELSTRMAKITQTRAMAATPKVMQRLRELVAATRPPGTPPPPPPVLNLPGGSPIPGVTPGPTIPTAPAVPATTPTAAVSPSGTAVVATPAGSPAVHNNGKTEPGH